MSKSCLGCPSLLPATDSNFFKKSVGVPVCARYGKPLGRMNSTNEEKEAIAEVFAANCAHHGDPKPLTPNWDDTKFLVTLPDPDVVGAPRNTPDLVNTCAGCKNFVREDVVARDLGFTSAICSAKGKLLLANRYVLEARHCQEKSLGTPRHETNGLIFLPEYEPGYMGLRDPAQLLAEIRANFVDPRSYESDKPVDDADKARGIRAWMKHVDKITKNEVFTPIYSADLFDDEQRSKIPQTGDDEHPEDYIDHHGFVFKVAVLWTELDETPAVWGMPGTGKTELFRHLAWLMQVPFERFSITSSTDVDDLAGKMAFTEGVGTHFEKGRFTRAWTSPCVIVVDEYNVGQPEVQQFLRPAIDNSKQLVIEQDKGRHEDRHIDCYLGVAMNPAWDPLNVGTNMIGDADANRLVHLSAEIPPEAIEREIVKTRCQHDGWDIPDEKLDLVMAIAEDLRKLTDYENQTLPITWAIRPQLKVARCLRWFDTLTAYRMAVADYLDPQQREMFLDVVRSHLEA